MTVIHPYIIHGAPARVAYTDTIRALKFHLEDHKMPAINCYQLKVEIQFNDEFTSTIRLSTDFPRGKPPIHSSKE
jgi:hypothetical protein